MSETLGSAWLSGKQHVPECTGKWCDLMGWNDVVKPNKDPSRFGSQDSDATTRCPTTALSEQTMEDNEELTPKAQKTPETPNSERKRSSPMKDGDTANDMLVRSLGWVQLPAPKERFLEQVTDVLEGLGVDYSVSQGEFSHVVKVQSTYDDSGDEDLSSRQISETPSTCASSDEALPARTHMAGQLSVQLEIA